MKKEKVESTKKRGRKSGSSMGNGKGRSSSKNKSLLDRECEKDLNLRKRVIIKNDGRYLIYYDF